MFSDKLNSYFKKKKNTEIAKVVNMTSATVGLLKLQKTNPSKNTMKKFFLASKGKIKPNDFFPLDDWKKELLTQKGETL